MASRLERDFQRDLVNRLRKAYRGFILVAKTDAGAVQGMPDLIVLCGSQYALLEVKRSGTASKRPNQGYYIDHFGKDTFTSFIYPENEEEVVWGMCEFFGLDPNIYLDVKRNR